MVKECIHDVSSGIQRIVFSHFQALLGLLWAPKKNEDDFLPPERFIMSLLSLSDFKNVYNFICDVTPKQISCMKSVQIFERSLQISAELFSSWWQKELIATAKTRRGKKAQKAQTAERTPDASHEAVAERQNSQ